MKFDFNNVSDYQMLSSPGYTILVMSIQMLSKRRLQWECPTLNHFEVLILSSAQCQDQFLNTVDL